MSPLGAIAGGGQPMEEAVVDAAPSSAHGSFSIISLSSASAASSSEAPGPPPPPVNTPAKQSVVGVGVGIGASPATSPGNTASLDQLFSCFYPLNRLWPFNWTGAPKEVTFSDSETENFEISLESIEVNFKENYIGGGNQSSVFRGKWRNQWIALKKLNRASEVDIKRLCSLDHPNVIKTLGVSTKDIYPCIVMEYCEKGGLFDYLRRAPALSKSLFLRWCVEVATGMAYLHSLKIVHRDLKSPNILVDNQDTLKICDFGSLYTWDQRLNSQNQALTQMASVVMSVCGTSQWMSPEMMKNEPCNEKVDVWSYGVVLWELLTGEVPFEKIAPMAVCFGVGSDQLRLYVPKTAPESVKFLLKLCWAKRPRNRPSFMSILNNLNNLQAELTGMQESGWTMRRELWHREIAEENAKLHNSREAGDFNAQKQKEEELVQKRMHELRHAQEIRQLYETKRKKVDRILAKIERLNQQMETQKRANQQAFASLNDRLAHNAHWHQLLHEWHAALRELKQQQGTRGQKGMDAAELNYICLQAEEARKAAMYLHGVEEAAVAEVGDQQPDSMASSAGGVKVPKLQLGSQQQQRSQQDQRMAADKRATGRPAILKMTYYDYDERGRRVGIEQKVLASQQQQQQQQGSCGTEATFGERRRLQKPQQHNFGSDSTAIHHQQRSADHQQPQQQQLQQHHRQHRHHNTTADNGLMTANANFYQHRRRHNSPTSSSSSSAGDEMGNHADHHEHHSHQQHHRQHAAGNGQQQQQRKKRHQQQNAINNNNAGSDGRRPMLRQQPSLMSSCPSECSSLANAPSSCSAFSRRSADLQSPASAQATPKSLGTSSLMSRDDSAISSAVPFSPSDRSLQNLANNNNNPHLGASPSSLLLHPPLCSNCQCNLALPLSVQQQFFARNSVARASGLSADSGVCQEDDSLPASSMLVAPLCGVLEENGNFMAHQQQQPSPISCCLAPNTCQCPLKKMLLLSQKGGGEVGVVEMQSNQQQQQQPASRWSSDHGGIRFRQFKEPNSRSRRPVSQVPFSRNSPLRTPSRRAVELQNPLRCRSRTLEQRRRAKSHWPVLLTNEDFIGELNPHQHTTEGQQYAAATATHSSHCSSSSSATLGRKQSPHGRDHLDKPRTRRLTELRQQSSQESGPNHHWFSSPDLCNNVVVGESSSDSVEENSPRDDDNDNNDNSPRDEQMETLKLGPIDEMTDSQLTERAVAAEKAMAAVMLESSSTMVSSLERSLEMAVAHSDGLSDRETKLKEAKTTFKLTHRRTASNPNILPLSGSSSSSAGTGAAGQNHEQEERCEESSSAGGSDSDEREE